MEFGERVFALRKEKGWSQEDLAEQLDVSRQSVSKWESGAATPGIETLNGLAGIFGVTLDELISGRKEAPDGQEEPQAPGHVTATTVYKTRKAVIALLIVLACAVALLSVLLARNGFRTTPDYSDMETLKGFVSSQLGEQSPYLTVDLTMLDAGALKAQLQAEAPGQEFTDEYLEEAVHLALADYFNEFEGHGLRYSPEENNLYYKEEPVGFFEDASSQVDTVRKMWVGEGPITVFVERDRNGDIVDFFTLNEDEIQETSP